MPSSPWDQDPFWKKKEGVLKSTARRWRSVDHREPIGLIWQKLSSRYPQGIPNADSEQIQIDRQIRSIARRFYRSEALRRGRLSGKSLLPIESIGETAAKDKSPETDVINQDAVTMMLEKLNPDERALIASRYGISGNKSSTTEIAEERHVSRQAVRKRLRKSEDKLRLLIK